MMCRLLSSWNKTSVKERKRTSSSWNDSPINVEKVQCVLQYSLNNLLGNRCRYSWVISLCKSNSLMPFKGKSIKD